MFAVPAGVGVPWLFWHGLQAIDRAAPDAARATRFYATVAALFVILGALLLALERLPGLVTFLAATLAGFALGYPMATGIEAGYGKGTPGPATMYFTGGLVGLACLALIPVTMWLVARRRLPQVGWLGAYGVAAGWLAIWTTAAVYHLATMDHQVELARAAERSPPAGLLLVLATLAMAAIARRRSARGPS